jgi:hypothetical protein
MKKSTLGTSSRRSQYRTLVGGTEPGAGEATCRPPPQGAHSTQPHLEVPMPW